MFQSGFIPLRKLPSAPGLSGNSAPESATTHSLERKMSLTKSEYPLVLRMTPTTDQMPHVRLCKFILAQIDGLDIVCCEIGNDRVYLCFPLFRRGTRC